MGTTTLDFFRQDRTKGIQSQGIFVQCADLLLLIKRLLEKHLREAHPEDTREDFATYTRYMKMLKGNVSLLRDLVPREQRKTAAFPEEGLPQELLAARKALVTFEKNLDKCVDLLGAKYIPQIDEIVKAWRQENRFFPRGFKKLEVSFNHVGIIMMGMKRQVKLVLAKASDLRALALFVPAPKTTPMKYIFNMFKPHKDDSKGGFRDSGGVFTAMARRTRRVHALILRMDREVGGAITRSSTNAALPQASDARKDMYFRQLDKDFSRACRFFGIGRMAMPRSVRSLLKKEMRLTKRLPPGDEKKHIERLERDMERTLEFFTRSLREVDKYRKQWKKEGSLESYEFNRLKSVLHTMDKEATKLEARAAETLKEVKALRGVLPAMKSAPVEEMSAKSGAGRVPVRKTSRNRVSPEAQRVMDAVAGKSRVRDAA